MHTGQGLAVQADFSKGQWQPEAKPSSQQFRAYHGKTASVFAGMALVGVQNVIFVAWPNQAQVY